MLEEDERNIEYIVGEVEHKQKIEGKGDFSNFAIGSFNIEKLLNALLVNYHLSDVLILVLLC